MLSVTGVGTDSGTVTVKRDHMGTEHVSLGWLILIGCYCSVVSLRGNFSHEQEDAIRKNSSASRKIVGIFPTINYSGIYQD